MNAGTKEKVININIRTEQKVAEKVRNILFKLASKKEVETNKRRKKRKGNK